MSEKKIDLEDSLINVPRQLKKEKIYGNKKTQGQIDVILQEISIQTQAELYLFDEKGAYRISSRFLISFHADAFIFSVCFCVSFWCAFFIISILCIHARDVTFSLSLLLLLLFSCMYLFSFMYAYIRLCFNFFMHVCIRLRFYYIYRMQIIV